MVSSCSNLTQSVIAWTRQDLDILFEENSDNWLVSAHLSPLVDLDSILGLSQLVVARVLRMLDVHA